MDLDAPGPQGDLAALDAVLADGKVVVVAGPGGVGKTTMAAALGLRAATRHDRRVVVVTVDPARRLAEALGVTRLTEEPVLVPTGDRGRVWALMIDMARSWDRLVETVAPSPAAAERLLANPLYRTLTRSFVQSHDYVALDQLLTLEDDPRHDLVVIDTPPSRHAIDLIDAPGRMIEFFDSRLLRWLTAGSGLGGAAARPFLAVAERLLGSRFLGEIADFFTLFAELRPGFVARSRRLEARLASADTTYVVVSTADPPVAAACSDLVDELVRRGRDPGLLVVNRLAPIVRLAGDGTTRSRSLVIDAEPDLSTIEDRSLAAAVEQLVARARIGVLPRRIGDVPVVAVPLTADGPTDLASLDRILRGPDTAGRGPAPA